MAKAARPFFDQLAWIVNLRADRRFRAHPGERPPDAWQLLSRPFSTPLIAALPFGLGFPI